MQQPKFNRFVLGMTDKSIRLPRIARVAGCRYTLVHPPKPVRLYAPFHSLAAVRAPAGGSVASGAEQKHSQQRRGW